MRARGTWTRLGTMVRGWVRHWTGMPARCRRAEREVRLQGSLNAHLNRRLKLAEEELVRQREAVYGEVPGLTPGEIERLAILAGACGEVAKAVSKILRFGWEKTSPYGSGRPNRSALEREIGSLRAIVTLMLDDGDLGLSELQGWQRTKRAALAKWTLYQPESMPREEQLAMMQAIREENPGNANRAN